MARTDLDLMEYANDAAAIAAYVSNAPGKSVYNSPLLSDANLKAYYRMESGALTTDSSGLGHTLTNVNTVGEATGQFGGCADFGATNSNKQFSIADNLDIDGGACSISLWVKMRTDIVNTGDLINIVRIQSSNTKTYYSIYLYNNGGTKTIHFNRGKYGVGENSVVTNFTLGTSAWHHLVLTYDGINVNGYVDGSVGSPAAASGNGSTALTTNLEIGAGEGAYFSSCYVDDIAFFNKALSQTEITSLNNAGLPDYSESTIKAEGSYSLKGIAYATLALNKTLTRTVSPTLDLSNKDYIGIYMRASRTGANIKIGFHDSGGTTTEITPTIVTADTWEYKILDISAVTNANKDVIDSIIVTIVNADADNTFYIDCVYSDTFINNLKQYRRTRFPGSITGI